MVGGKGKAMMVGVEIGMLVKGWRVVVSSTAVSFSPGGVGGRNSLGRRSFWGWGRGSSGSGGKRARAEEEMHIPIHKVRIHNLVI